MGGRKGEQKEEERTRRENVSGIFSENDRRSRQKSVGRGGRLSGGREGECGVSVEGRKAGRVIWDEIEGNRSGFKSCRRDGKGEEEEGVWGSEWGGGEGCVGRETGRDGMDGSLLLNWEESEGDMSVEMTGNVICFSSDDLSNRVEFVPVKLRSTHCRIL